MVDVDRAGVFDAVRAMRMEGRIQIESMADRGGYQAQIYSGCGHVPVAPTMTRFSDEARGRNFSITVAERPSGSGATGSPPALITASTGMP